MNTSLRWCAMVSGSCTLLESMCAEGLLPNLVVSDRNKGCRAEEITSAYQLPHLLLPRQDFRDNGVFDREAYTGVLTGLLHRYEIDFVTMVGFMTVLSPSIFDKFAGRITNNHPALLPAFPGDHAVRDALAAGVTETGCTIHVATARLDDGPIIAQERVPVLPGDTEATLHERIKQAERPLITQVTRETLLGKRSLPGFALSS
jgi:phosphoribosylglycinamide formyltransferase-1